MSRAGAVTIGPQFFRKELRSYADWRWAWAREACQNAFDCGSTRVDVTVELRPMQGPLLEGTDRPMFTLVRFRNDGTPMTEEVLTGKFLALGETGKGFDGTTGGFGKAKILLVMSHELYSIRTGTLLVQGCGGSYDLTDGLTEFHGTETTVLMDGDQVERMRGAFKRFAQLAQWYGELRLDGELLETKLKKGSPRREFEWAKVYSNRQHEKTLVVRVGGQPMFTKPIDFKGCVILELTGTSADRLTDNRDGLRYQFQGELDDFLVQLSVDKRSALRQRQAEIRRFEGERLKNEAKKAKPVGDLQELFGFEVAPTKLAAFVRVGEEPRTGKSGLATEVTSREEVRVTIGPEFLLQNTTGMAIPDYYVPGPQFSDYSRKLALAWAKCLLKLHEILGLEAEFSIGFCLDEDAGALHSKSNEYGTVYYIAPAKLVSQKDKPQCRSFKAAFTGAWADRFEIISIAVHEITHGQGFDRHDEDYAAQFTANNGKVLARLGEITPLFRG